MNKVILVGYMGVGKSTIGELLSQKLATKFIDLDTEIEKKCDLKIDQIFKLKGEIYFRKIESQVFTNLVKNNQSLIISSGGGTPCYAQNHLLLNAKNTISIYLKASLPLVLERLNYDKMTRPLIATLPQEDLKEFVAKHLFERSYFYNQATYTVIVDNKDTTIITEEIVKLLH